jgi:hypothetical protein
MKTAKKRSPSKRLLITSAVAVLTLFAAYGLTAHHQQWWPFKASSIADKDASRNEHVTQPSPKNPAIPTKSTSSDPTAGGDKTTNEVPVSKSLSASITQLAEANNQITFAASVSNATTTGTCVVTFSNTNDRPVTKQFNATYSNGTAQCGPTNISAYEFSYLGQWQVSLRYYENGQQATAEGSINIR